MNDLIVLFRSYNLAAKLGYDRLQNVGHFETHPDFGPVSLGPHDTNRNIQLNFLKSIRSYIGLSNALPSDSFKKSEAIVNKKPIAYPAWKKYFESLP